MIKAPLTTLAWCDEAGCPATQCVHCKSTKETLMNEANRSYAVEYLQAVDPEFLGETPAITVTVTEDPDSMGFPRVDVVGPTAEAVIAYVRENWGDEDPDWFREYVIDRVHPVQAVKETSK